MSISGQQDINIGLPNESINSDSLYAAFTKTQLNFDTLFTCASPFTNFVASTGIGITSNSEVGSVTVTNTGVTKITAGTNIVINQSNGNVTISATGGGGNGGGGTVTSVGLQPVSSSRIVVTNSPVISSGVIGIDLATTGAVAGTYTNPNVSVDAYGRITSIAAGPTVGTVTSVGLVSGPGISVGGGTITSAGNFTVTNTGVIKLTAGNGIDLSSANGNVTVSLSQGGVGTVTSVGISSSSLVVTGGPITTTGVIGIELPANPSASGTFAAGNLTSSGNLTVTGNANVGNLTSTAGTFLGTVTAASVYANSGTIGASLLTGTLTTALQPNITTVGTLSSLAVSGNITSGNASLGNAVTANFFAGSGQYLSSIQGSNVTGVVGNASNSIRVTTTLQSTGTYYVPFISATANANYGLNSNAAFSANIANGALIATRFVGDGAGLTNITGANVSGQVSFAATANAVAGANVSGQVNFAATANAVAGANVVGQVSFAATANAVAGANVTGTVANATYAANAGSAISATSATTAGTVTTAAQPNITSVGTLSSLNVTGDANVGNLNTIGLVTAAGRFETGFPVLIRSTSANGNGYVDFNSGASSGNIYLRDGSSLNTRIFVNPNGNVGIANIAPAHTLSVTGTTNISGVANVGSLTTTGNITGGNLIATSYHIRSVGTGISASGSTQGTATALTKEINLVSTVSSGQGVILPAAVAGMVIIVNNTSAADLNVYPAGGAGINNVDINSPYTHIAGASLQYYATSSTQWYTVGASYA